MNRSETQLNEKQLPEGRNTDDASRKSVIKESTDTGRKQDKSSDRNAYPNLSDKDYREGVNKIKETARGEHRPSF